MKLSKFGSSAVQFCSVRAIAIFAFALLFAISPEQQASAQLIQIGRGFGGGVRIRVPFVAVDTAPWGGGTRVRAPFTSVNTGVYSGPRYSSRYAVPVYPNYAYPPASPYYGSIPGYPPTVHSAPNYLGSSPVIGSNSAYGVPLPVAPLQNNPAVSSSDSRYGNSIIASATPAPLLGDGPVSATSQGAIATGPAGAASDDTLRRAAMQLQASLSQRGGDSDIWMDYLAPAEIVQSLDSGEMSNEMLQSRLRNYQGVTFNPELRWLTSLPGFAQTRRQLENRVAIASTGDDTRESTPQPAVPTATDISPESAELPESLPLPLPQPDAAPNGANSGQPTPAKPVAEPDAKKSVGI